MVFMKIYSSALWNSFYVNFEYVAIKLNLATVTLQSLVLFISYDRLMIYSFIGRRSYGRTW